MPTCRVRGLTLMELVIVVAILAILASVVVPIVSQHSATARDTAARASLVQIRNAIVGSSDNPGFLSDTGQLPGQLTNLFNNPFPPSDPLAAFDRYSAQGWRGPYLVGASGSYTVNTSRNFTAAYGATGDPAIIDPWGNPIIIQIPTAGATSAINRSFARLISAGPNGVIDTPQNYAGTPYPPAAARGDDIILFLDHADSYP